jgi:hypothetical protein
LLRGYCNAQRRTLQVIFKLEIGLGSEQHGEHVGVAIRSGRMTGGPSVLAGTVDTRARSQKKFDNLFSIVLASTRAGLLVR